MSFWSKVAKGDRSDRIQTLSVAKGDLQGDINYRTTVPIFSPFNILAIAPGWQ